jgi:beta-glucosidase/6-phospho-beta-glucosidase/beta-galactosidase
MGPRENPEWNWDCGARFGVVCIDFETVARTQRRSAAWFREAARQNAVV